jgi:RimJ/RimL family protein N-acetyltransferase
VNGDFCGVYELSGKLVGIIDYISSNFDGATHVAFISLLMIGSPWRKRGIGTQILRLVEDKIREIDLVSEIQTAVQLNNPGAMRFWRRNGYRVFGDPVFRPDQTVVTYLRKNLFSPE